MPDADRSLPTPAGPPPAPFAALAAIARRAAADIDAAAVRRRMETDRLGARWQGGRRRRFDQAAVVLDATTARAVADLRVLARVAESVAEGAR